MNSYYNLLRTRLLPLYGEGESRAIAFLVMEDAFGVSRTEIYADKVRHFSEDEHARLLSICQRLEEGEPVQYVLGKAWFCGRSYRVTPAVLIPRPETEELVAWASSFSGKIRILDAGTGSGCIAISLKLALPQAEVVAWDLSEEALKVARQNAEELGADVRFEQRDMLAEWPENERFDLIVSNPPYICERERSEMEAHVLEHEPGTALFVPDDDALRFYRALVRRSVEGVLLPGGSLLVEINSAYGPETVNLFKEYGLKQVELRRDDFGNDRMVGGVRPESCE